MGDKIAGSQKTRFLIRGLLIGFMVGLVVSGVTAFPLPLEVSALAKALDIQNQTPVSNYSGLVAWIALVHRGLDDTTAKWPFLFYGTDWLAFGHIVIALSFIGPLKDPVRNVWVIQWATLACILVIPLALICGFIRGIPFAWQMIDCSFGVIGLAPLLLCQRLIAKIVVEEGS